MRCHLWLIDLDRDPIAPAIGCSATACQVATSMGGFCNSGSSRLRDCLSLREELADLVVGLAQLAWELRDTVITSSKMTARQPSMM